MEESKTVWMQNINEDSIKFIIEDNFNDLFVFMANKNGLKKSFSVKMSWVNSAPYCWPNIIFNNQFENSTLANDLKDMVASIKNKVAPPFCLIGPKNGISDLGDRLQEHGLRPIDSWPGMAVDLEKINSSIDDIKLFKIKIVDNKKDLFDWFTLVSKELFPKKKLDLNIFMNVLNESSIKFFIGYYKDEPVSTAMNFYSSGVVGTYMISTSLNHRSKGLGTAITAAALSIAKKDGYGIGILQSTQSGFGVYTRLGFKEYCHFDVYWMLGNEFR